MSALPTPHIELVDVPQPPTAVFVARTRQVPVQQPALELPLFHESVRRRKPWWTAFSVSKVGQYSFPRTICCRSHKNHRPDHVCPNLEPTSYRFFLGFLSDKDFGRFPSSPIHVSYSKAFGEPPVLYDLRVERVGKGIGFRGLAEHKITSTLAQPLEAYTVTNDLMFGLLAEDISL
jgi:hypothetical protein